MKIETRIVIKADEGMMLTDGEVFGKTIMLGEGRNVDEFHEITKEEYDRLFPEENIDVGNEVISSEETEEANHEEESEADNGNNY